LQNEFQNTLFQKKNILTPTEVRIIWGLLLLLLLLKSIVQNYLFIWLSCMLALEEEQSGEWTHLPSNKRKDCDTKSMYNRWPVGQICGERGTRASGEACTGRPVAHGSQASSRSRAGPQFFFSTVPKQNDIVLLFLVSAKKKEKGEEICWAPNGFLHREPSFNSAVAQRLVWASIFFFKLYF